MRSDVPITMQPTSRPSRRLVAGAIIATALANGALAFWLPICERERAIAEETAQGRRMAEQILTTRNHYIETVVRPLLSDHESKPTVRQIIDPVSVPAPSRFALDVSDVRHESDASVTVTSPYSRTMPNGRLMDAFQKSAWDAFQIDPDQIIVAEEKIGDKRAMRIAIADRMTSESCVPCYNLDPSSPKHDWGLGDVRAVMQVDRVIEGTLVAAEIQAKTIITSIGAGSLALSLVLLLLESAFAKRRELHLEAESKIRFLAFHDPMTGLLNRTRFNDLFAMVLRRVGERSDGVTLHLVDLDHFKAINDVYGHAAGDDVIRIAADRLRAVAGTGNLVARIGGDEFVVAQLATATPDDGARLAEAIVAILAEPFAVGRRQFTLSASVGVRYCPPDVQDATVLFKAADKALYKAKQRGRGRYAIYDADLDRALTERRQIEDRLKAIADDPQALTIVYQPLCDVQFGEVRGFEALMRISAGHETPISAEVFIPIAEELGVMAQIGAHVLNRALRFANSLPDPLTIAVNISPRQFFVADAAQSIVEVTRRALEASGFPAHRLELEITEGLFLQSSDHVTAQLQGLKDLGVKLALDDFGVGYCSLGYLSRFPVDKLKIDKSFLSDAIERPKQLVPILKTIASLGETLGLVVVAEGIETSEQAELAERVGCHQLQGFYFCRPIDETDVAAYLQCNQIGTHGLREAGEAAGASGCASFWSRLIWTKTSGVWAPAISKAS